MTLIQTVNTGGAANDGTGDPLRSAFTKINASLQSLRSDLSTAPHAVLLGDSITGQNTDTGTNKNAYHGPRGYMSWAQIRMGFPFNYTVGNAGTNTIIGDNKGVSGDTTALMLARLQADVLNRNPDIVFVLGGTNDINSGTSYASVTGNLNSIYSQILARGAMVAAIPVTPRTSASDWSSSARRQVHHAVNQWIRDKALSTQGMILVDPYSVMIDPTTANGDARSGFTADGLHFAPIGAFYIGKLIADIFSPLMRPCKPVFCSQSDTYDAPNNPYGNMVTNGLHTGTGGTAGTGATGSVATNWQAFRNSGTSATTITASKTTRSDGLPGDVQQLVVATGGGSGASVCYFTTSPSDVTTGVDTNSWYEAACEIDVSGITGTGGISGIYLELWDTSTNGARVRCLQTYAGTKFPDVSWSGILKTPALQPTGTTGLRFRVAIEMDEAVTSSVTVKVSRCYLRKLVSAPVF